MLAGLSQSALSPVGAPDPSSGFETEISATTIAPYVAVQALGPSGALLATSLVIAPS